MTKITIGQYYPTESCIHKLDPRVKLCGTILYVVLLLVANHFAGYLAAAVFLALIVKLSQVPPKMIFRGLRAVLIILIVIAATNIFMTPGGDVLVNFGFIRITSLGLLLAFQMSVRLVLLISGSSILTLTTSPIELTDGIEFLLRPLKKIRVPAHDIAMMMTIALRFIPTLAEELDKIIKAQKARGADFDTGGLIKRGKSLLPILVPLFVSAFKRAEELATAMEARCYRGDINRTKMKEMNMKWGDWFGALILTLFCGLIIMSRFL